VTPGLAVVLALASLAGLGLFRLIVWVLRDLGWLEEER
jgi:hypothetical protein